MDTAPAQPGESLAPEKPPVVGFAKQIQNAQKSPCVRQPTSTGGARPAVMDAVGPPCPAAGSRCPSEAVATPQVPHIRVGGRVPPAAPTLLHCEANRATHCPCTKQLVIYLCSYLVISLNATQPSPPRIRSAWPSQCPSPLILPLFPGLRDVPAQGERGIPGSLCSSLFPDRGQVSRFVLGSVLSGSAGPWVLRSVRDGARRPLGSRSLQAFGLLLLRVLLLPALGSLCRVCIEETARLRFTVTGAVQPHFPAEPPSASLCPAMKGAGSTRGLFLMPILPCPVIPDTSCHLGCVV